jgi:hypothetical protein
MTTTLTPLEASVVPVPLCDIEDGDFFLDYDNNLCVQVDHEQYFDFVLLERVAHSEGVGDSRYVTPVDAEIRWSIQKGTKNES